jgi:hypothetical protein
VPTAGLAKRRETRRELLPVLGVNLVASCTGDYEPVGFLLWLPVERRYGIWDSSHCSRPGKRTFGDRSDRNMSSEYDLKLDRIRKLVDASHGQGWAFVPRAPRAEQTLVEWEAEYGVVLPKDYRLFLREIADGGVMPGS